MVDPLKVWRVESAVWRIEWCRLLRGLACVCGMVSKLFCWFFAGKLSCIGLIRKGLSGKRGVLARSRFYNTSRLKRFAFLCDKIEPSRSAPTIWVSFQYKFCLKDLVLLAIVGVPIHFCSAL